MTQLICISHGIRNVNYSFWDLECKITCININNKNKQNACKHYILHSSLQE